MKRKTNDQKIKSFVSNSPIHYGFLFQGVHTLAQKIVDNQEEVIKGMKENHSASFINPELWIQCAKDWLAIENEN